MPGVIARRENFIVPMSNSDWNAASWSTGAPGRIVTSTRSARVFATTETPLIQAVLRQPTTASAPRRSRSSTRRLCVATSKVRSPIGRRLLEPSPGATLPHYEVVGVAKDTKYPDVREGPRPIAYLATTQEARLPPLWTRARPDGRGVDHALADPRCPEATPARRSSTAPSPATCRTRSSPSD